MSFDPYEALDNILQELRDLAAEQPDLTSALVRLLRAVRDGLETAREVGKMSL